MCTLSVSNVIYHKFSHGVTFYTLNGKNVNVMLELGTNDVFVKRFCLPCLFYFFKFFFYFFYVDFRPGQLSQNRSLARLRLLLFLGKHFLL